MCGWGGARGNGECDEGWGGVRREGTLEDDATTTAPSRAVILWPATAVHAGGRRRIGLHARAASLLLLYTVVSREATSRSERPGATHLVVPPNLAHEAAERLVDVDALLRGRFDELAAEVLCEVTALCVARSANAARGSAG